MGKMCIRRSREEEISKHVWRLGSVYVCLLLPRSLSAPLQSVEMSLSFFGFVYQTPVSISSSSFFAHSQLAISSVLYIRSLSQLMACEGA